MNSEQIKQLEGGGVPMVEASACLPRIAAADAAVSRATAERHESLLELVNAFDGDTGLAVVELTGLLRLNQRGAERLVAEAESMRYLPRVHALLKAAAIDPYRAWLVHAELSAVLQPGDPRWAAVEAAVCRKAPRLTSGQLRNELQRLLIAVDPDAARKRHQKAKKTREVVAVPDTDGMITILARLAAADGALIMLTLHAMADAAPTDEPRTRAELLADAISELFRALIEGRPLKLIPIPAQPQTPQVPPGSSGSIEESLLVPEDLVAPVAPVDLDQAQEMTWTQRRAWRCDGERPTIKRPADSGSTSDGGASSDGGDSGDSGDSGGSGGSGDGGSAGPLSDRHLVRAFPEAGPMPTPLPPPPPDVTLRCVPDVFRPPALPTRQGARIRLNLHADLNTITGGNDLPAWLSGYGAITADAARDLARQADSLDLVVRERPHPPGHLPTAGTYRPPQDLRRRVAARFPTCRGPGCGQPADRCDQDHVQPFTKQGPTCDCNLISLCRHCHGLKTDGYITPVLHPDGTVVWRTRAGQSIVVPPPEDPGRVEHFDALTGPENGTPGQTGDLPESA